MVVFCQIRHDRVGDRCYCYWSFYPWCHSNVSRPFSSYSSTAIFKELSDCHYEILLLLSLPAFTHSGMHPSLKSHLPLFSLLHKFVLFIRIYGCDYIYHSSSIKCSIILCSFLFFAAEECNFLHYFIHMHVINSTVNFISHFVQISHSLLILIA